MFWQNIRNFVGREDVGKGSDKISSLKVNFENELHHVKKDIAFPSSSFTNKFILSTQ